MKIALDPYMHRHLPLPEVTRLAAEIGYEYIELSPRPDFVPFFVHPRADKARIQEFKTALRETGVKLSSILPVFRWSSPIEAEREAAMRYWKRTIEIAVELECPVINTEFARGAAPQGCHHCPSGPAGAESSEGAFWKSMEEILPIFEKEGLMLHLEPHPDDFIEDGNAGVDMVRAIDRPFVKYLYCAPHTYHMGGQMTEMIHYAAPLLAHVHVADTLNHKASSGLRYIVNPPGSQARVHQHLNIGEGEIDWDEFFGALHAVGFDGIVTSCVFAWEDRAVESSRFMLERIKHYLQKYWVE